MKPLTPEIGTVYLSGPMTGIKDHNYPAFNAAAKELRDKRFTIINPAEMDGGDTSQTYEYYLRRDVEILANSARAVVVLPGWRSSKGAKIETDLAFALGMPVVALRNLLPVIMEYSGLGQCRECQAPRVMRVYDRPGSAPGNSVVCSEGCLVGITYIPDDTAAVPTLKNPPSGGSSVQSKHSVATVADSVNSNKSVYPSPQESPASLPKFKVGDKVTDKTSAGNVVDIIKVGAVIKYDVVLDDLLYLNRYLEHELEAVCVETTDKEIDEYISVLLGEPLKTPNALRQKANLCHSSKSILEEAQLLVHGDRGESYGSPLADYECTGTIWAAMLNHYLDIHHPGVLNKPIPPIPAEIGCLMMCAVKMSRLMKSPDHRDSKVDLAGYAECSNMCVEEKIESLENILCCVGDCSENADADYRGKEYCYAHLSAELNKVLEERKEGKSK